MNPQTARHIESVSIAVIGSTSLPRVLKRSEPSHSPIQSSKSVASVFPCCSVPCEWPRLCPPAAGVPRLMNERRARLDSTSHRQNLKVPL